MNTKSVTCNSVKGINQGNTSNHTDELKTTRVSSEIFKMISEAEFEMRYNTQCGGKKE